MAYEGHPELIGQRPYTWRTCLVSLMITTILTFLCVGGVLFTIDSSCVSQAEEQFPPYPDSVLLSQSGNAIRPFGIGMTIIQRETDDSPDTVRGWYANLRRDRDASRQFRSTVTVAVESAPEGDGSIITYVGRCSAF